MKYIQNIRSKNTLYKIAFNMINFEEVGYFMIKKKIKLYSDFVNMLQS